MQLCLDGRDPSYHDDSAIDENFVHDVSDDTNNIVGPKGMKGIERLIGIAGLAAKPITNHSVI